MYQIRKGWPCHGAIDETLSVDSALLASGAIKEGTFVDVAGGSAVVGTSAVGVKGLVIGVDKQANCVTALLSDFVVECDDKLFAAGCNPVAGDKLSVAAGGVLSDEDHDEPNAIVLSVDAMGQTWSILWHNSSLA